MNPDSLKSLRERLGLTQVQLAKQLGVVSSTIAKWEQGVHPIPPIAAKFLRKLKSRR